jgi:hypothetical protein
LEIFDQQKQKIEKDSQRELYTTVVADPRDAEPPFHDWQHPGVGEEEHELVKSARHILI